MDETGRGGPDYNRHAVELVNTYFRQAYETLVLADQSEMYYGHGRHPPLSPSIFRFPKPYVVYVLNCEPIRSEETIKRRARQSGVDISQEYIEAAINSPFGKTYIGCTANLYRRLSEHMNGDGAYFTSIFPPKQIKRLSWYNHRDKAETAEVEQAKQQYRQLEFVYPYEPDWECEITVR